MNSKYFIQGLRIPLLLLAAFFLTTASSFALDLAAVEAEWTLPGSTTAISMWGFIQDSGSCPAAPVAWQTGPAQTEATGATLTVNLRNCLSEPVSIIIAGQPAVLSPQTVIDAQGRTRIRAFTHEASADGGIATYTWNNLKPGTYLYQSGSHPAKQVQMGLYGALTVGSHPGADSEVTLLYSEIDPALHASLSAADPLNYKPKYFLINGRSYESGQPALAAGAVNGTLLIRFLNAGFMSHVPVIQGPYLKVIAEDGNPYPYPREQYAVLLAAGKTLDALWSPTVAGRHAVYDRSMSLTSGDAVGGGMLVYLDVGAVGSLLLADAGPDQSGVAVGAVALLDGSGSIAGVDYVWSFVLKPGGSAAALSNPLIVNPTFTPDVAGTYEVQLVVSDITSSSAPDTVIITTNLPPVADAGPDQAVSVGAVVTLNGNGSSDADLDPLTFSWTFAQKPVGSIAAFSDPTTIAPVFTADVAGTYGVQLVVNDGAQDSAPDGVTITANPVVNSVPVAVDDFATVIRNSPATFINLVGNDSDADGTIDPNSIIVTTGSITSRGGTVIVLTGGVNYAPKKNFLGTDTFNYTVMDNAGGISNEATVRVNVVRP